MKYWIYFLLVSVPFIQPVFAKADALDESERAFELEVENVDIRDLEAQKAVALDEATHQEQLERQHKQDLIEIRAKKASLDKKAKAKMNEAEYRRHKAEKAQARYDAEIARIQKQISDLRDDLAQTEARAEDAEQNAMEEKAELAKYKQERNDLLKRTHRASTRKSVSHRVREIRDRDLEAAYHDAESSFDVED